MSLLYVLILAFALSLDAFSVSLAVGLVRYSIPTLYIRRYYLIIGLFHVFMMFIGWLAGEVIIDYIGKYGNYVSFLLLSYLGVKMMLDKSDNSGIKSVCFIKLRETLILGLVLSVDAIMAGLTLSTLSINIIKDSSQLVNAVTASLIVGFISYISCVLGVIVGQRSSKYLGRYSMYIGGIVLILLGVNALLR